MMVSEDKYRLPMAVEDTIVGLARKVGVKPVTIRVILSRARTTHKDYKYVEVDLTDED